MGYRKVGYLEQCWYVVKYAISTKLQKLKQWRRKK